MWYCYVIELHANDFVIKKGCYLCWTLYMTFLLPSHPRCLCSSLPWLYLISCNCKIKFLVSDQTFIYFIFNTFVFTELCFEFAPVFKCLGLVFHSFLHRSWHNFLHTPLVHIFIIICAEPPKGYTRIPFEETTKPVLFIYKLTYNYYTKFHYSIYTIPISSCCSPVMFCLVHCLLA